MASQYGKEVITQLSDGQAIGYGGSKLDSTNMAFIGGPTGARQTLSVYAQTAISIATGEYWYVEVEVFTADTAASAVSPFKTAGAAEDNAHLYLLHKTSADAQLDFAAGERICEYVLPNWFYEDGVKYDWVQVTMITDKTDPGTDETVSIFTHAVI